jgi:hypothetical protein
MEGLKRDPGRHADRSPGVTEGAGDVDGFVEFALGGAYEGGPFGNAVQHLDTGVSKLDRGVGCLIRRRFWSCPIDGRGRRCLAAGHERARLADNLEEPERFRLAGHGLRRPVPASCR